VEAEAEAVQAQLVQTEQLLLVVTVALVLHLL
jgi:hypothetical protein